MSALPILGYKRHPRPVLGKDPAKDLYAVGAYLDSELQRLENSLDTNSQETINGITEAKQQVIDLSVTTGQNTAAITQEATVRTSADSAMASLVTTLTATVTDGDNTNAAAISNELLVRANADSALASDITTLTATVTTADSANAAAITTEATARADADSALATTVTNLAATVTNGDNTNAAAITQEATARANADSAVATTVTNLAATVTSGDNINSAAISSEATARANADSALSSTVSSLTSTVNGVSASVTAEASARVAADNTLLAKYGVTLNSNGYITGFSQNNDGTTGSFKIIADEFKIINPNNASGQAGVEVFGVSGGYATIKNIRSAASGARLQIDSDLMSVYDASGVLRVKLGNLS